MARILRTAVPVTLLTAILVALASPTVAEAQHRHGPHVFYGYPYYGWYYPGWWGPWGYGPYVYPYVDYGSSSLRIQTQPETADVFVDGYLAGTVDEFNGIFQRLRVTPGGHEIAIYHPDHQTFRRQLYLRPAGDQTLKVELVALRPGEVAEIPVPAPEPVAAAPAPGSERAADETRRERPAPTGTLVLRGLSAGAELLVDGALVDQASGSAPLIVDLAEGRHTVTVRSSGTAVYEQDVLIRRNRRLELTVR